MLADRETLAERQGWPSRAQDEPPTRRVRGRHEGHEGRHEGHEGKHEDHEAKDQEATRRTNKETTVAAAAVLASAADQLAKFEDKTLEPKPPVVAIKKPRARRQRAFRAVLFAIALFFVINEIVVSIRADRLTQRVATEDLGQLDAAWAHYADLSTPSLGLGTFGVERALRRQTINLADRVIANYRTPSPSVREAQWRAAKNVLARAVAMRGDDAFLEAMLRYCDGHLHRIDGEARKARKLPAEAQREFADAVVAFREAAALRSDWADPYLGLMRTFIYGLDDVERGEDALRQAQKRGYTPGDRETAQLAEGHRVRAETLVRSARELAGLSQELQYLNRAADEYRRALDLYSQVPAFPDTARQMRIAQRALASTEERITKLTNPVEPALPPPPALPTPPAPPAPTGQ
jgi:hypothetical protein